MRDKCSEWCCENVKLTRDSGSKHGQGVLVCENSDGIGCVSHVTKRISGGEKPKMQATLPRLRLSLETLLGSRIWGVVL